MKRAFGSKKRPTKIKYWSCACTSTTQTNGFSIINNQNYTALKLNSVNFMHIYEGKGKVNTVWAERYVYSSCDNIWQYWIERLYCCNSEKKQHSTDYFHFAKSETVSNFARCSKLHIKHWHITNHLKKNSEHDVYILLKKDENSESMIYYH